MTGGQTFLAFHSGGREVAAVSMDSMQGSKGEVKGDDPHFSAKLSQSFCSPEEEAAEEPGTRGWPLLMTRPSSAGILFPSVYLGEFPMRGFLNNLFRNFWTARTARPARRALRRANLQLEGLEQRDTPAVTFLSHAGAALNFTPLDSNVQSIDAGTDGHGDNMVAYVRTDWFERIVTVGGVPHYQLYTQSDGYAIRDSGETIDSTGYPHWTPQMIATNVQSMSAGRQGNIAYVTTGGAAFWYSESTNSSFYEASGVAAITAGTDNGGYLLLEMLFTNGRLSQSDAGSWWTSLNSNVASIGKAHNGVLDLVFSGGYAYTDGYTGLSFLMNNATTAA